MTENERLETVRDWMAGGFRCSQAVVMLSLAENGAENPELIRALAGLGGGMSAGRVCGALTGGCCLLAMHAEGAENGNAASLPYKAMTKELVHWFENRFGTGECAELMKTRTKSGEKPCAQFVCDTYQQCAKALAVYGVTLPE